MVDLRTGSVFPSSAGPTITNRAVDIHASSGQLHEGAADIHESSGQYSAVKQPPTVKLGDGRLVNQVTEEW